MRVVSLENLAYESLTVPRVVLRVSGFSALYGMNSRRMIDSSQCSKVYFPLPDLFAQMDQQLLDVNGSVQLFLVDWKNPSLKDSSPDGYVLELCWVDGVWILFEYGEVGDFTWCDAAEFILFTP